MPELKAGGRLFSSVCETQIIVIKGLAGDHELSCSGATMTSTATGGTGSLEPQRAEGTVLGRRYVNADETFEVLCVKAGGGTLCLDDTKLIPKQAKALPSSD
jgi:hypothetical protein